MKLGREFLGRGASDFGDEARRLDFGTRHLYLGTGDVGIWGRDVLKFGTGLVKILGRGASPQILDTSPHNFGDGARRNFGDGASWNLGVGCIRILGQLGILGTERLRILGQGASNFGIGRVGNLGRDGSPWDFGTG